MNEKEYIGYCEKELTRFEARRYQFMGMEWEDLNKADHTKLLEIGSKVMNEDNTVNLYMLHRNKDTRLKMWGMVARTALHYDNKFPTDDRLQLFVDSLEEHFNNMVTKELEHSDMNKVSQLVSDFEPVLSSDDLEKLKADIVLVGLV
jgi:magnesium-transporting ATPase (P-type)